MENQSQNCSGNKIRTKKCFKRKNKLNKKEAEKTAENIKNLRNVTKTRITLKHGIFAKGIKTDTCSRNCLSEEFEARLDGDLNKLINLANGVIIENDEKTDKKSNIVLEDGEDILLASDVNSKTSLSQLNQVKSTTKISDEELDAVIYDPANKDIFKRTEIAIAKELKKYLTDEAEQEYVDKLKKYLRNVYQKTLVKQNESKMKTNSGVNNVNIHITSDPTEVKNSITLNPLKYLSTINKSSLLEKKVNKLEKLKKKIIEKDERFCDMAETCKASVKCKISNLKSNEDSDSCTSSICCDDIFDFEPPEPMFFPRRMNP